MGIAKSRNWTEVEVLEVVAAIKMEPGLWEELEYIEKTTADFRDTDLVKREWAVLKKFHPDPECELNEMSQLYGAIRKYRRAQLGLK